MTFREIVRESLALPLEKRFRLFEQLGASLDHADILSPEWRAEIKRRSAEIDQGKAKGLSWETVKKRMKKLKASIESKR
jgi:putative addiction module component (TIGR02574 family)